MFIFNEFSNLELLFLASLASVTGYFSITTIYQWVLESRKLSIRKYLSEAISHKSDLGYSDYEWILKILNCSPWKRVSNFFLRVKEFENYVQRYKSLTNHRDPSIINLPELRQKLGYSTVSSQYFISTRQLSKGTKLSCYAVINEDLKPFNVEVYCNYEDELWLSYETSLNSNLKGTYLHFIFETNQNFYFFSTGLLFHATSLANALVIKHSHKFESFYLSKWIKTKINIPVFLQPILGESEVNFSKIEGRIVKIEGVNLQIQIVGKTKELDFSSAILFIVFPTQVESLKVEKLSSGNMLLNGKMMNFRCIEEEKFATGLKRHMERRNDF